MQENFGIWPAQTSAASGLRIIQPGLCALQFEQNILLHKIRESGLKGRSTILRLAEQNVDWIISGHR